MRLFDRVRRGLGRSNRLAIKGVPSLNATIGQPYSFQPAASGGRGQRTFAIAGTVPPGLSFNTSTGALTGTPT